MLLYKLIRNIFFDHTQQSGSNKGWVGMQEGGRHAGMGRQRGQSAKHARNAQTDPFHGTEPSVNQPIVSTQPQKTKNPRMSMNRWVHIVSIQLVVKV